MLGQSELTVLVEPTLPSNIFQGITTDITGEGGSAAPLNDAIVQADKVDYDHLKITPDWRRDAQYFARVEKQGIGINMADFVGATQVWCMVLGDADKQPTAAGSRICMKGLVREAMAQGAVGLSTSLEYRGAVREDRGADCARGGSGEARRRLRDAHALGGRRRARGPRRGDPDWPRGEHPGGDWHVKAAGKRNWGRMKEIVAKIDARARRRRHHR